jgi:hypothetical protein
MSQRKKSGVTVKVRTTGPATVTVRIDQKVKQEKLKPLIVTLPDIVTVPADYRGQQHIVYPALFGTEGSNPKLRLSNNADTGYLSWGLSLAPAHESGYQLCASASEGCIDACLYHQGRGQCSSIAAGRIGKTIAFMEHRQWFETALRLEMDRILRKAEKLGLRVAVRMNLVSDVMWEKMLPWLFRDYPGVQFYDYTKHLVRMLRWCRGELPRNYHLTYSRSECNERATLDVLRAGGNAAVVFRDKRYPATWNGFRVVSGDDTDLRFLDPKNVVVALYAKGSASKDESGFVLDTTTSRRIALSLAN